MPKRERVGGSRQGNRASRPDALKARWEAQCAKDKKLRRRPPTADELDEWMWLMDPRQVTDRELIETVLEVKLAGSDDYVLAEEAPELFAPFKLRPAQIGLDELIDAQWAKGHGAKVWNLKARQHGISTYGMAKMAVRAARFVGDGKVVCQDDDSNLEMFDRLRGFLRQFPSWVLPNMVKDRDDVIRFEHEPGKTSSVRVLTAGKHALGRSTTNHWVWISEFPWWPERGKVQLPGFLKTIHSLPGNFVVGESTARGFEQFHRRWVLAEEGRGGWVPYFANWLMHPDYRRDFKTPAEREAFEKTVGSDDRYGGEVERVYVEQHGATLEQLNFRRYTLDGDLEGHIPTWNQEFPTTPADAFISTGRPVFGQFIDTVLKPWITLGGRPGKKADLRTVLRAGRHQVSLDWNRFGLWDIYELPQPGKVYCWGADPAQGHERHSDGKHEADWTSVKIKEVVLGHTVASLRAHIFPLQAAEEVMKAAFLYGGATGLPETNLPELCSRLQELEIGGVAGFDLIRSRERLIKFEGRITPSMEPGFKTSAKSKPLLVGYLTEALREWGGPREGKTAEDCPMDRQTMEEATRFVYTPTGGMEAAQGFDDTVVSEALALMARQECLLELPTLSMVHHAPAEDEIARLLAHALDPHRIEYEEREILGHPILGAGF